MSLTYGVVALARPTFDVEFAEQMKDEAFAALDAAGIATAGPRELAFDEAAAERALAEIAASDGIDLLLIMQVTFTDATMTVRLAREVSAPLAIWAFPEPRIGGRLRLNAFCGLNLAAHALGKAGRPHGWLYAAPDSPGIGERLRELSAPAELPPSRAAVPQPGGRHGGEEDGRIGGDDPGRGNGRRARESDDAAAATRVLDALSGARIGVLGEHPAGFDTCAYDAAAVSALAGVEVRALPLDTVFDKARAADPARAAAQREKAAAALSGLDEVDQEQLERSFRLLCALEDIAAEEDARGLAVRCWPETFTEYGCAACGPMAMMNEAGVPSACEADVYGSLTTLMLQELAGEPVWMADLVDLDPADQTGVLWHCGLAPLSMRDPEAQAEATIHTNRKMPLLHQFPLKPGRVTLARVSQARNEQKLMLAGAEVLRAPMAFTGTSGVVRFDRPVDELLDTVMREGLEHHYGLAYGDHRPALRAIAARMELPVLELT